MDHLKPRWSLVHPRRHDIYHYTRHHVFQYTYYMFLGKCMLVYSGEFPKLSDRDPERMRKEIRFSLSRQLRPSETWAGYSRHDNFDG